MHAMSNYRVANAGSFFVSAWLLGLFVAPSAPGLDASGSEIAAHYAAHGAATALQSVLIHGVAGVALMVLALSLSSRGVVRAAGLAAGAVSLFQAGVGLALSSGAAPAWFDVLNTADTVKLVLLGAFIWLAGRPMGPRMRRASAIVAPLQAVAGAAFVTGSSALFGLLYVALPVLLAWVGVVAYLGFRAPAAPVATT